MQAHIDITLVRNGPVFHMSLTFCCLV